MPDVTNSAVPAAPAAPAPAPSNVAPAPVAPAPVSPAPTQQHDLSQAQLTGPVTLPSVAPAAPEPAPAPAPLGSPEARAVEEQRVKDAQRRMHEATAETAKLRNQLSHLLNHPMLGPVIDKVINPRAPVNPQDDEVKRAWKEYQAAPSDEDAFRHLLAVTEARAKRAVLADLQNRDIERTNRARAQQRDLLVANAINKEVNEKAPDIPLELFWAMSSKAEVETPAHLVTVADKLEWQIGRAVELARAVIAPRTNTVAANAQQSQQVRQTAAVVMAPGSQPGSSVGGNTTAPMTFVDQLKASQARKIQPSQ